MKAKTKFVLVIGAVALSLGLMQFSHNGSFNPSQIGFYTSIGAGIVWYIASYYIFNRFLIGKSKKENNE